jgi:MFS family permease
VNFRKSEAAILAAVFLDLLGFGMILTNIQLRAEALIPKGWPTGLVIGILLASTFVVQLLASPRWGKLSDRVGRKPVIVACTAISGIAMFVYGFAGSIWLLLLSRLIAGFGAANIAVAQASVTDRYEDEDSTAALGRIGASISAGLIVGPVLGGWLAHVSEPDSKSFVIGTVAGVASLLGGLLLLLQLPNSKPAQLAASEKRPVFDLRLLREFPNLVPLIGIAAVAWLSLAMLVGTFNRLIESFFGYRELEYGILFGFESLVGVLVQGILLGWIVKRWRERKLLIVGYLLQGIGLALSPASLPLAGLFPPMATLVVASGLYAFGTSISNPTVNGLSGRMVPVNRTGELFGLMQGARSLGYVAGPLIGGLMFDWYPSTPYLFAGGVCVVAAVLVAVKISPVSSAAAA